MNITNRFITFKTRRYERVECLSGIRWSGEKWPVSQVELAFHVREGDEHIELRLSNREALRLAIDLLAQAHANMDADEKRATSEVQP